MLKINLITPIYIGRMGLPGKEIKLYNIGKYTYAEETVKKMGYRIRKEAHHDKTHIKHLQAV